MLKIGEFSKPSRVSVRMLRHYREILVKGYSTEREEFNEDVSSIAVPFFNYNKELIGTISVTVFASAMPRIERDVAKDLKQIAKHIESRLGTQD